MLLKREDFPVIGFSSGAFIFYEMGIDIVSGVVSENTWLLATGSCCWVVG
jgi:hypothetical protein